MMRVAILYDTSGTSLGGHDTHLAFKGLPVEIAALADSNCENISQRMKKTGAARHYTHFEEMVEKEKPQILVLGSRNPETHFAPITYAAERGIHILCEKPLCTTLEEADKIVELSKKYHVKIAVGHLARYSIIFRKMKEMMEKGEIGEILSIYGRGKEDERGGGEDMAVLGAHILDLMCFLGGEVESCFAEVRCNNRPLRSGDRSITKEPVGHVAGDNVFAHLHFASGIRGIFESRKGIYTPEKIVRMGVTVEGTKGYLSMRYITERPGEKGRTLRLSRSPYPVEDEAIYEEIPLEEERIIPGAAPLEMGVMPYFSINNRFAAWDLLQAIEEDREPIANAVSAQKVLEITQAIYLSQLEGKRMEFPLLNRKHPLQ